MSTPELRAGRCCACQQDVAHPDQARHRQMNLLLSRRDEAQRRWSVALEADRVGPGGDRRLAQITGRAEPTIRRGRTDLAAEFAAVPTNHGRRPGGGRPAVEKKDPTILTALATLVAPETAGDPMSEQKWVRSSLRQVSRRLAEAGHRVSHQTVGRLRKARKDSRHVNAKRVEARSDHPDRDDQFADLAAQRRAFQAAGLPVSSVDTKKKELIGNVTHAGRSWGSEAEAGTGHDFRDDALGRAVPYGIYDVTANRGTVSVGESGDTPAFAVASIARWWEGPGRMAYPRADRLLILADGGGSNGHRPRRWKQQVPEQLGDRLGLTVTVCHDPTGCAKWNPIEHRLFGPISLNWAGKPLRTWETLLGYIGDTTTTTGLRVEAALLAGAYPTGVTVSDAEMAALALERHAVCPTWNYTIRPRPAVAATPAPTEPGGREVIL